MKRKAKYLLFVDSSTFIGCALEEVDGSSIQVLKDLKKRLDKNELILVTPELVVNEVNVSLEKRVSEFKELLKRIFNEKIGKNDNSRLITTTVKQAQKFSLQKLEERHVEITKIIKSIFEHKNTYTRKVNQDTIYAGIKRSLFKQPPFTSGKGAFVANQDCINFELLFASIDEIEDVKNKELIICANDKGYSENLELKRLDGVLEAELKQKVKTVHYYSNPLKMLNDKFKERYTKHEVQEFGRSFTEIALSDLPVNAWMPVSQDKYSLKLADLNQGPGVLRVMSGVQMADLVNSEVKFTHTCPKCGKGFDRGVFSQSVSKASTVDGSPIIVCPYCGHYFPAT